MALPILKAGIDIAGFTFEKKKEKKKKKTEWD